MQPFITPTIGRKKVSLIPNHFFISAISCDIESYFLIGEKGPNDGSVVLLKDDFYQSQKWKMCNCTLAIFIFNQQLQKKNTLLSSVFNQFCLMRGNAEKCPPLKRHGRAYSSTTFNETSKENKWCLVIEKNCYWAQLSNTFS